MIANKNILISGAGISGLTLAHWLQRHGFSPTLIEKRPNLNDRGPR
ncbi:MAG: NAD(P)-binding protein [Candidatus Eiseniibacteriota bacterium]